MRVNIQFSVDLEDVPDHISRALDDAGCVVDGLNSVPIISTAKEMIGNNNFVDSIKIISDYREILLDLDHRLDDCMRIMIGYQQVIANPEQTIEATSHGDHAPMASPEEAMRLHHSHEKQSEHPSGHINPKDLTDQLRRKIASVATEVKGFADDAGGFE